MKKITLIFLAVAAIATVKAQVKIGTNPTQIVTGAKLQIDGDATTTTPAKLIVTSTGKVGIGTAAPTTTLEVNGDVKIQGLLPSLSFSQSPGSPLFVVPLDLLAASTQLKLTFAFSTDNTNGSTAIWMRTMNPLTSFTTQGYTGPCGAPALGGYYKTSLIINRPVSADGMMIIYLPLNSNTAGCQNQNLSNCSMTVQAVN